MMLFACFPWQEWLHECATVLCYMYIATLIVGELHECKTFPQITLENMHIMPVPLINMH